MNLGFNKKWKTIKFIGICGLMIYFSWNMWQIFKAQNLKVSMEFILQTCANHYIFYLLVIVGLLILTYSIEGLKWFLLIRLFQKIPYISCLKAIIVSQLFAINTPARTGDFIGKIYYLENQHKMKGVFLSFYGNFAQMLLVCVFALLALLKYPNFKSIHMPIIDQYYWLWVSISVLLSVILLVLYYQYNLLLQLLKKLPLNWLKIQFEDVPKIPLRLSQYIMGLSFIRLAITVGTYFFLFNIFLEKAGNDILFLIIMYLFTLYFLPTFHFLDVIVRGSVGVYIFSIIPQVNPIIIISITSAVWFFNIFFPAFVGLFIFSIHHLKQKWLNKLFYL